MKSKKIRLWFVGGVIALVSALSAMVYHSCVSAIVYRSQIHHAAPPVVSSTHVAGTWNLNYLTNNCSVPGGGTLVLDHSGEDLVGYYFVSGAPPCLIKGSVKAPDDIHFDVNVLVNTHTYKPILWLSFDGKFKRNEDGSFSAEGEFSEHGVKLNRAPNVVRQAWRAQHLWPLEESNSSLLNRWQESLSRKRHGG